MQDLNDMLFLAEVVDRGGFAAAGRSLGVPKSKLSRRVSELEARLGVRLLLRQVFKRTRHNNDVEALVRVMVLNRLCDPDSKVGVLRWVETIALPGVMAETIEHQHLLRAMDAMVEHKDEVDHVLASLLRPLIDQDLAVVFYDMTTIRAAGLSRQDNDVRQFGMSKEGVIARQVMLGVVQTAEGLPPVPRSL